MKCPDEELIFRYANGEEIGEREELQKHLAECDSCRKAFDSYSLMRNLLSKHWDGKIEGCFDTEALAKYSEGLLDDSSREMIKEHIAECDVCASELELMRQMVSAAEEDLEIPDEVGERIYQGMLEKQQEILLALPLKTLIKEEFSEAARRLTEAFIKKYHESEQSLLDHFWRMFSTLYNRDVRFGSSGLSSALSGLAGDAKGFQSPPVIFTMLGVCDHLHDYEEVPDEKVLMSIIKENEKRFAISRRERRKLEEFLIEEFARR